MSSSLLTAGQSESGLYIIIERLYPLLFIIVTCGTEELDELKSVDGWSI